MDKTDLPAWPTEAIRERLSLRALIDGAYDIVELWQPNTPAQHEWKSEWMAQARKHGAIPSW